MIQAISTPGSGTFMLDANNTKISIQSTNGEGYYYRAGITIDGLPFDTQGWSRTTADTATKDLKDLYKAYFTPRFSAGFVNMLEEQTHLLREVGININEYSIESGNMVASLSLPRFRIVHNIKPVEFTEYIGTQFLDMRAASMLIPATGKIAFPFYVWGNEENVVVTLATNSGAVISQESLLIKGKKILLYQFDLAGAGLSPNVLFVTATVQLGGHDPIMLTYRINRLPAHRCNEIVFMNNFGFYIYAYPCGEMQISNSFAPAAYTTGDGNERIYEIPEEATYTINSGSLRENEKAILNMIANSHDVKLNNGNKWVDLITATKKQLEFKSRQHQYDENLSFTLQKGTNVANTGLVYADGLPDIYITSHETSGRTVRLNWILNNGFNPPNGLQVQYRASTSTVWSTYFVVLDATSNTMTINLNRGGLFYYRLREFENSDNVSNQVGALLT
jgi:hypothetical protein